MSVDADKVDPTQNHRIPHWARFNPVKRPETPTLSPMIPHWTQQLARSLSDGRLTTAFEAHFDALLLWLSNPENPRAAELDAAIRRLGLSRRQASERAYELLDQWLFDHAGPPSLRTLGLPADADPTLAKQRYRRLIQVYHPDRHAAHNDWATRRTERINLAFAASQDHAGTASNRPSTESRPSARRSDYVAALQAVWSMAEIWLRHAWDLTAPFPRWRLAGLGLLALLLTGLFLSFSRPPPARPVAMPVPQNTIQAAPSNLRLSSAARPVERPEASEIVVTPDTASATKPTAPAKTAPVIGMAESRPPASAHDAEPAAPAVPLIEPATDRERTASVVPAAAPQPEPSVSQSPAPSTLPEPQPSITPPIPPDRHPPPIPAQLPPHEPRLAITPTPSPNQPVSPLPPAPPAQAQQLPLTAPQTGGALELCPGPMC